jgi:hypothetical protein
MNKTIITELERARTIMGLKPKSHGLLNEQGGLYDDIIKLFSRKTIPKEAAEKLVTRLNKLMTRDATLKIGNVLQTMTNAGNMRITKNGSKFIVSDTGAQYRLTDINNIIVGISNGTINKETLEKIIARLPERFADGSGFRGPFGTLMKELEEKVAKETSEKTKIKTDDTKIKTDDTKIKTDGGTETTLPTLKDLKSDTLVGKWTKSVKNVLFSGKFIGFAGVKQKALKKWMNNLTPPNLNSLLKELNEAAGQSTVVLPRSVEDIVYLVGRSIERGTPIPPEISDDIIGILLRSDSFAQKNGIIDLLGRNSSAKLRRQAKKGELSDEDLRILLGGKRNSRLEAENLLRAELTKVTVGGTLIKATPKTLRGWLYVLGASTVGLVIDLIVQEYQKLTANEKAIAGLTEKFYQKFKGNEKIIFDSGGLSNKEAEAFAKKLYAYLQGWMFMRDLNEFNNIQEFIEKYPNKNDPNKTAETIDEIPNNSREKFLNDVVDAMSYDNVPDVGWFKYFTGVPDNQIINVIKQIPTVLAMSQVTYFYNKLGDETLMSNLGLMNAKLIPGLSTLLNLTDGTKQDVFNVVADKEWLVGSQAADDDMIDVADRLTQFWPEYATARYNETGDLVYSRYKPNALISTDNLERISNFTDYSPYGTEDNDWDAEDFQEFLNNLKSEEFNSGQCYGLEQAKCQKPYFTTDKNLEPDGGRLPGAQIQDLKDGFTAMVKDLYDAFINDGIKGVKKQIEKDNEDTKDNTEGGGRNPTPNITEGLINILNNK